MKRSSFFRSAVFITVVLCLAALFISAQASTLTLPGTLTTIEEEAFFGDISLDEVVLPESLTTIGKRAFANSSLKKITIPASVIAIGDEAFVNCEGLEIEVYENSCAENWCIANRIPFQLICTATPGLTYMLDSEGNATITGGPAEAIHNLVIPAEIDGHPVTRIGESAFRDKKQYTGSIVIPEGVTYIGDWAFSYCDGFDGRLFLPNSVIHIGVRAFNECHGLTGELHIPYGVEYIGLSAFNTCWSFSGNLVIPDSVTYLGQRAFYRCYGFDGSLTISGNVKDITQAFDGCTGFTGNLMIPDGVTKLGTGAFRDCSGFTGSLIIPDSVRSIGNNVFSGCSGLKTVRFPYAITNIADSAFYYCDGLIGYGTRDCVARTIFESKGYTYVIETEQDSMFEYETINASQCRISKCYSTDSSIEIPQSSPGGRIVTEIGEKAFLGNSTISTCVIPEGVTSIKDLAFADSTIQCIDFPTSLTSVSPNAFDGCNTVVAKGYDRTAGKACFSSIDNVIYEKKYDGILIGDFYYQEIDESSSRITGYIGSGEGLIIPDHDPKGRAITQIGDCAFDHHTELTGTLIIPDTVEYIGSYAFAETRFTTVVLTDTLSYIADTAFYSCPVFITEVPDNCYAYDYCDEKFYLTRNDEVVDGLEVTRQDDGSYKIIKFVGSAENLILPSFINNYPVVAIGDSAFSGSSVSGSITLPDRLQTIGDSAFVNCSLLTGSLTIPDSVTSIGRYAFSGCSGFNGTLKLPSAITYIAEYTFNGCNNFTGDLIIPNSVTRIEQLAFCNCARFTSLTLSDHLFSIAGGAFMNCSRLSGSLILPSTLRYIYQSGEHYGGKKYDGAFEGCYRLTGELVLPNGLIQIGGYAFKGCGGFTGPLNIPDSVTSMGELAFYGCSGFTSLKLSNGLTTISGGAFGYCSGLTGNLVLPVNLVSITESHKGWFGLEHTGAFQGCGGLTGTLVIPSKVTNIELSAFSGCSGLSGLEFAGNSITTIGSNAFANCSNLQGSLVLPNSIITIANNAFQNCGRFSGQLILPSGLTSIGDYAFSGCGGFTGALDIPNGISCIALNAFSDCRGLTSVSFPASVTQIKGGAFYNCVNLTGVLTLPERLSRIEDSDPPRVISIYSTRAGGAFQNCSKITKIVWPSALTYIGYDAFNNCTGLQGILDLPDTVQTVSVNAFLNCRNLTGSLILPHVVLIDNQAFMNCSGFDGALYLGNQLTTIGKSSFENCSGFTGNIDLPDTLVEIRAYAFRNCSGFNGNIIMGDNLVTLGDQAFCGCSKIRRIPHVSINLRNIGSGVIDYIPNLSGFTVVPDYVYSLNLFAQYENVIVQTEEQYSLRAEAERILLQNMLNRAQVFSDQFKLEHQDINPAELLLVHIPIDVLLNAGNLDYGIEEEQYLLNQALKMCSTNQPVTLTNVELIPEWLQMLNSYSNHANNDYFMAIDALIQENNHIQISFQDLGNRPKQWLNELLIKDELSQNMSELNQLYEESFIQDIMNETNLTREQVEGIVADLRFFGQFVYVQRIISKYGTVSKYINNTISALNSVLLMASLDTDKLAEISRLYIESGNETTRKVGYQLKEMAEGTIYDRLIKLITGRFIDNGIDAALTALTSKLFQASETLLFAKIVMSEIHFISGVGNIPKLRRQLIYDYNLAVDNYQSFVVDLTNYLNHPSDNLFEKAYWSYIVFCNNMINVQNDNIQCIQFGDSTLIGGLVSMSQEEKITRSQTIISEVTSWKTTAETLFTYRNSSDSQGFHDRVCEINIME